MAWWKLEWIKLKRKRSEKILRRRKMQISPIKQVYIHGESEHEESRLEAPVTTVDVPPARTYIAQCFSTNGMARSKYLLGVLKIPCDELESRVDELLVTPKGQFSSALWGATKVHVKSYEGTTPLEASQQAKKELNVLLELRHPGMLYLMGLSYSNTQGLQLVFENISLGSLYNALHIQQVNFSVEDICRIFIKLCEALSFMHQNSWLHLGLSSHGVQLTAQSHVKLSQFELAKHQNLNQIECRMNADDAVLQEKIINWQAPEQCLGETVGTETDVYSLTVMLQEMIIGRIPWEQAKAKHVRKSYASGTPLDNHGLLMSADTHAILQRGLEVNRLRRTLSLKQIEQLCARHLGSNVTVDIRILEINADTIKKKNNRSTKFLSFGTFKRHLSGCQSCAFNASSSPDPLRRRNKKNSNEDDILEVPEEIYFDDHFDATAKLGTHLQLLPQECSL